MNDAQVLISGGGPGGLICAYALGKRGIDVAVFDENPELQDDPRAATTHPATLELLAALGVIDEVIEQGLVAEKFEFRFRKWPGMVHDICLSKKDNYERQTSRLWSLLL